MTLATFARANLIALLLCLQVAFQQPAIAADPPGANLVQPANATLVAVKSGRWQDRETWGLVPEANPPEPKAGEQVYIPPGITVANHGVTRDCQWIHVAGTLTCCDHCDTQLNVHTLYVPMGGKLDYGSVGMPRTGRAVIEFTGGEPLPGDWQKLSGGLICHGMVTAAGNEKTAWDAVEGDLAVGSASLVTANVPFGWQVGDAIIVAGTDSTDVRYQTEQRTINAIAGRTVTLDAPLKYRHFRWRADLPFHCANLTRNVIFRSRKTDVPNRGHLMFMSPAMDLRYIAVENCGRTDKSKPVTDPRQVNGVLVAGSDANPRARYPIHWHRVGNLGPPATARGVVVYGSPGWSFVNHASNVQCDDSICVNYFGAGFCTEEGQERGWYRRCLASGGRGQGDTIKSSDDDHGDAFTGNWGTDGSGFWMQGGLVELSDCVAFDNSGRGFALFNQPLNNFPRYNGAPATAAWIQFPITVDPSLVEGYTVSPIPSGTVPQRVCSRITAYMCKAGVQAWNEPFAVADGMPTLARANLRDVTIWGRGCLFHGEYMRQANIDGLKIVGDGVFRSPDLSITKDSPGLFLSSPHITVKRYAPDGLVRTVTDIGSAADQKTHAVEVLK